MMTKIIAFWIRLSALSAVVAAPLSLLNAALVFPEKRRAEILESTELILDYSVPERIQIRLLPDPFDFGRLIAEDKPTQAIEGIDNEELLSQIAVALAENILGYLDFGDRALFPTKDFGLLKEGDFVTVTLPDQGNQSISVQVLSPSRRGFTIRLDDDLETFVPANSINSGIRPAGISNPPQNAP